MSRKYFVGVDLGGTNIVAGALAEDGTDVLAMRTELTRANQGADAVIDRIARMIDTVVAETIAQTGARRSDFAGVGVGAPGPLDRKRGIVVTTPNLGWTDFPLRDAIAGATKLPVRIDNDANCATLGEWWSGAAVGATNVIGLTIGTGIGGGIISMAGSITVRRTSRGNWATRPSTSPAGGASAAITAASRPTPRAHRSPNGRARPSPTTTPRCWSAW
jgi:glucokinase